MTTPPPSRPAGLPVGDAPGAVTALLLAWGAGDRGALDALVPVVYAELRRQAARALRRERAGHTLQTTAVVHEAYLRLADHRAVRWQNRAQFFGVAAQLMRRILVDHARSRRAAKRGGGARQLTLGNAGVGDGARGTGASEPAAAAAAVDVLELHDALTRLAALDPAQARLVELRYFAGLSIEETAAVLGVSTATVKREWRVARAWLRRALGAP